MKPGVLQFMELQRVRHNLAIEQQQQQIKVMMLFCLLEKLNLGQLLEKAYLALKRANR